MPKRSRRGYGAAWTRSSIQKFPLRKPLRGRLALIVRSRGFAVSSGTTAANTSIHIRFPRHAYEVTVQGAVGGAAGVTLSPFIKIKFVDLIKNSFLCKRKDN